MGKALTIIYIIISALLAIFTTVLEIQPSLFFINLSAPNPGDKYDVILVLLITWLIFLSPLVVVMLFNKIFRNKSEDDIDILDRTGVYVTREKSFQSALVGIPVYINSKKVGVVDNGKTKFFEIQPGKFSIRIGKGKQASEIIEDSIDKTEELNFSFNLETDELFIKIKLKKVELD